MAINEDRFTVRLDDELIQDMNEYLGFEKDTTKSQVARKALRQFFSEHKNKIKATIS